MYAAVVFVRSKVEDILPIETVQNFSLAHMRGPYKSRTREGRVHWATILCVGGKYQFHTMQINSAVTTATSGRRVMTAEAQRKMSVSSDAEYTLGTNYLSGFLPIRIVYFTWAVAHLFCSHYMQCQYTVASRIKNLDYSAFNL